MIGFEYDKKKIIQENIRSNRKTWEILLYTFLFFPFNIYNIYKPKNTISWIIRGVIISTTCFAGYIILAPITWTIIIFLLIACLISDN